LRQAFASQAHHTIRTGGYDVESMVSSYLMLFERLLREAETGVYRRPYGQIRPLPSMKPFMKASWTDRLPASVRSIGRIGQHVLQRNLSACGAAGNWLHRFAGKGVEVTG